MKRIMKANFKKLRGEVAFDEFKEVDIARQLGNYIHATTSDIGLDDVARVIYYSEGEVEIPDELAQGIIDLVNRPQCNFLAWAKRAIINELTEKENVNNQ